MGALLWRDDVSYSDTTNLTILKSVGVSLVEKQKQSDVGKIRFLVDLQPYDKLEEHLS